MFTRLIKPCLDQVRSITVMEWAVWTAMIGLGIASRLYLESAWNFKPVAALILFGGFYFRHWLISAAALLAIMLPSDMRLGWYDWPIMSATYLSLMLAAWLGSLLRRTHGKQLKGWSWMVSFGGAALAMSVLFHVLTNAAVWWVWYPRTWQGLMDCYVAAIPFFRPTLESNLLFTALTIGCYVIAVKVFAGESSLDAIPSN